MCARYKPRVIDFHRIGIGALQMPAFEEFTEKPRFLGGSSAALGAPIASANALDGFVRREEIRPTDFDLVVRMIGDEMRLDVLRWGLVPPHEFDSKISYATFNAKSETIAATRAFRHAWENRQRCLIPVEAFFEWKGEKSPKQKYQIGLKSHAPFCLAGLWEKWQRDGNTLETYTIITTAANELLAEIHDKKRMPVILDQNQYDRWLHDTGDVSDLLKPYPADAMEAIAIPRDRPGKSKDEPTLF